MTVTRDSVVDASAIAALIFAEKNAEAVAERLETGRRFAPVLLYFELANICLKKMRVYPAQKDIQFEAFDYLERLDIEIRDVDYAQTVVLAQQFHLSAYDAAYLWLAKALDAELVTLDQKLERAALQGHS